MGTVECVFQIVERGELAECLSIIDLSERVGVPDAFSATPYVVDYRPRHASLGIVVVDLEMPLSGLHHAIEISLQAGGVNVAVLAHGCCVVCQFASRIDTPITEFILSTRIYPFRAKRRIDFV